MVSRKTSGGIMNRDDTSKQPLWANRHQPVQSYSRSGTDHHEHAALLSPVHPLEPRVKRSRIIGSEGHQDGLTEHRRDQTADSKSGNHQVLQEPDLKMRPLTLERGALAPCLAQATAPFAKSDRKKAYVSAIYYSECLLRGIQPLDADSAAFDIQNRYQKWWVQSKHDTLVSKTKRKRDSDPVIVVPDAGDESRQPIEEQSISEQRAPRMSLTEDQVSELKKRLVEHLQKTGGDTATTEFQHYCSQLQSFFKNNSADFGPLCQDGTWLTLSKPTFSECQGRNENGEYMYTLGRMSFDMFRPNHLKCSIRAVMNNIRVMDPKSKPQSFPSRLAKELKKAKNPIRHYE
jgi:hypothetical protein